MVFTPRELIARPGRFRISASLAAKAHTCLTNAVFEEFWHGFTFHRSHIVISQTDEYRFTVGQVQEISPNGNAYAIRVTEDGISIVANDEKGLRIGFMTLLDRIRLENTADGEQLWIDCFDLRESPLIENRMVHFCIFPETKLWEIQKFIRFSAALKYTHLILEFWGMLQYDCLKELSWEHAFTKAEIRPLIAEAKALGLEIVPMFNHWGHASASRVMHGKHVVLDQNPTLQYLFSDNGWCWDIRSPRYVNC